VFANVYRHPPKRYFPLFYNRLNWKRQYDGLLPTEMPRLKQLEDENAKLRKVVTDLSPDKEMLQDVIRRKL
jgi:putative transposase